MLTLNRAGLDNLGHVLDQMGRARQADVEVMHALTHPGLEAGPWAAFRDWRRADEV